MLKIGSVIGGKYKILSVIGRGGMSVVYLALNEAANKPWAVKELLKKEAWEREADRREIEMMKRLRNPHLPGIADVIEQGDSLLIVMDYVEGRSLEALLQESGAQPVESVLAWAIQLCQVLTYLHSQSPPVIYRDLKPSNVMLKPDGTIVLIDLGAAREYKPGNQTDTVALGTRGYAAPEQYEERGQSDARTDIYSMGVLMFRLLTGEGPHLLQPVRKLRPEIPAGLEAVINRCTGVRKEERYQNCRELGYALEHYREQDERFRREQRRKLRCFGALAALTLLCFVLAGVCAGLETRERNDTYEAWLRNARNAGTKAEEIASYQKAVSISPARPEAWLGLLEEGYLDDGLLTRVESRELRSFLLGTDRDGRTRELLFRENKKGYGLFAYEAGIAYFYKFEETENKKSAKAYLKAAAESGGLSEQQRRRAKRLLAIAEYYGKIGVADEAGDDYVDYGDYWSDLRELTAGNLVEEDNARTALVLYEELAGQILARGTEFQRAGVTEQELRACLTELRQHLKRDFVELPESRRLLLQDEMEELGNIIDQAERTLRTVRRQEE